MKGKKNKRLSWYDGQKCHIKLEQILELNQKGNLFFSVLYFPVAIWKTSSIANANDLNQKKKEIWNHIGKVVYMCTYVCVHMQECECV